MAVPKMAKQAGSLVMELTCLMRSNATGGPGLWNANGLSHWSRSPSPWLLLHGHQPGPFSLVPLWQVGLDLGSKGLPTFNASCSAQTWSGLNAKMLWVEYKQQSVCWQDQVWLPWPLAWACITSLANYRLPYPKEIGQQWKCICSSLLLAIFGILPCLPLSPVGKPQAFKGWLSTIGTTFWRCPASHTTKWALSWW